MHNHVDTAQRTATQALHDLLTQHFPHGYACGSGSCQHNLNSPEGWAEHVTDLARPLLAEHAAQILDAAAAGPVPEGAANIKAWLRQHAEAIRTNPLD